MSLNRDRYLFDPLSPAFTHGNYSLYRGMDNLKNSAVYVGILGNAQQQGRQKTSVDKQMKHLGSICRAIQKIKHQNLSEIYEVVEQNERLTVISQIGRIGPVETILRSELFFDEKLVVKLGWQAAAGLKCLHDQDIIHGYISLDSLELDEEAVCKLSVRKLLLQKACISPEFRQHNRRNKQGDVFSLGCVIYKLLYGTYPTEKQAEKSTIVDRQLPMPITISKELYKLIESMLQEAPQKRPSIGEVQDRLAVLRHKPTEEDKKKKFPKEVEADCIVIEETKTVIAHGPYAKEIAFVAINRHEPTLNRIKVIPLSKDQDTTKIVYRFINLLQFFKDQQNKSFVKNSFVRVIGHYLTSNSIILVQEYCNQGILPDYRKNGMMSQQQISEVVSYCGQALKLYNQQLEPYCWFDPFCILVSKGRVKIDTPILQFDSVTAVCRKMMSSVDYIAPEKKVSGTVNDKTDVWSLAVVKYWLMTNQFPSVTALGDFQVPRNISADDGLFLSECLNNSPHKRRTLEDCGIKTANIPRAAIYYDVPESTFTPQAKTLETTIADPVMVSEANEEATLKPRQKLIREDQSRLFGMTKLQLFLYRRIRLSSLTKRQYFSSIQKRTNNKLRGIFKATCACILLTLFFYLFFFLQASALLYRHNSLQPLSVPIIDQNSIINNYTLLTLDLNSHASRSYTIYQIRDQMNCARQRYYDPNQGGHTIYLKDLFNTNLFKSLLFFGYVLVVFHYILLFLQYLKLDIPSIVKRSTQEPKQTSQLVKLILVNLFMSCMMAFHFAMYGSWYVMKMQPCLTNPTLPSGRWLYAGKGYHYFILIIGVVIVLTAILYLLLSPTEKVIDFKTSMVFLLLYLTAVGFRGFSGFDTTKIWISLCGVLPELVQLFVFILAEVLVDIPSWCWMRWSRLKDRRQARFIEASSTSDQV